MGTKRYGYWQINSQPTLDKKQVTDNEIQAPMDKGTKIGTATIAWQTIN